MLNYRWMCNNSTEEGLTFDPHGCRTVFRHRGQDASVVAQVRHGFPVEVSIFGVIGRRIGHQVGPHCFQMKTQIKHSWLVEAEVVSSSGVCEWTDLLSPHAWESPAGRCCWWCPRATGSEWGCNGPHLGWALTTAALWSRTRLWQ